MSVKTKKIAITMNDGSVHIMGFVLEQARHKDDPGWKKEGTPEEIEKEVERFSKVWPVGVKSWRVISDSDIPADRTFRNALRDDGTKLHHDMAHAREIHREHLRHARLRVWPEVDAEYMKADEVGDEKKKDEVIAKKQLLRDVTDIPEIEAAQTTEELKSVWPDILPPR